MPTREHDPQTDDLAPLARDAAALLDGKIAAARPVPDFSAMLARARELDPAAVPEAAARGAEELAPVIPLGGAGEPDDAAAIAPFTAALRGELDARIAERRMAGIPPPAAPGRGRRIGALLAVAVAAAALLLVFARPAALDREGPARGVEANAEGASSRGGALHEGDREGAGGHVLETTRAAATAPAGQVPEGIPMDESPSIGHVPEGTRSEGAPASGTDDGHVPEDTQTDAAPPAAPGPEDSDAARPAAEGERRARAERGASKRRPPAGAAVPGPSLEDEAQALWERGELAAAERKYREIVEVAGRGLRAELAYGDLFALARQIRGADGQVEVWREYLKRFPGGRFADDARAGLCQRAAADARAACWREYLERHPQGAHRKQAEAAIGGAGEGAR